MLDRLRKTFGSLLAKSTPSAVEAEPADPEVLASDPAREAENEALLVARREAQQREQRLILTERIHNRAAALQNELRTSLVNGIHRLIAEEVEDQSLHDLLQVTLDSAFTAKLDGAIEELVRSLFQKLEAEFESELHAAALYPRKEVIEAELKLYRDSVVRKYLLEQLEVLALPTSTRAFPETRGSADELKDRIARYWSSCRDALDKFFRSVEMVLLDGARDGIRIDAATIRERLLAAQYRNGYRLLEDRFRTIFAEISELERNVAVSDATKTALDRRVVDEIIVPLAYFIRERTELEPREALSSRASLLTEIVDRLVARPDPFPQTAEAVKPVLRKSVEQARPMAAEESPYLRAAIESLNPTAIHRTTALLRVLAVLVQPDLDERALQEVEQVVRLNRVQYQLFQLLARSHRDLVRKLSPLDRIAEEDAALVCRILEREPSRELVEDLFLALGYQEWPESLPSTQRTLLRFIAVIALPPEELADWPSLYLPESPSPAERARLAKRLLDAITPSSVGSDERVRRLDASPLPVDLGKALTSIGYLPSDKDRASCFREEVGKAIREGEAPALAGSIRSLRELRRAMVGERIALGATLADADPYFAEIWRGSEGTMVGVVLLARDGFGKAPIETLIRDSAGNGKEAQDKLRRQLLSQALIYHAFGKLFSAKVALPKERRRALPTYLKTLYEPAEASRPQVLARLKHAKELIGLVDSLARQIADASPSEPKTLADANSVAQILSGLAKKTDELRETVDKSRDPQELGRVVKEYDRAVKYLNTIVLHSVNPWLHRQTVDLGAEFEFKKEDVENAVRRHAARHGLDWTEDVKGFEAHPIRGTLGCRALVNLADGTSKVVLLEYDRKRQDWQVRHMGPRLTDVVRQALQKRGRTLPDDYDEKYEQPTFRLDEQSCRFLWLKQDVARVEATLVLDGNRGENPWRVVYLKYNDEVLVDRSR